MAIRDKFEEQEKNGMKIVTNMNGEKRANGKLNMMMAKLTRRQKAVIDKKQNIANLTGKSINVKDLVSDKAFQTVGDKDDPATVQEVNDYIKTIKKGN
tara:strand:- start:291 stop:584 length:294 start_codon:yes stop_codon:yes gene_type:complete